LLGRLTCLCDLTVISVSTSHTAHPTHRDASGAAVVQHLSLRGIMQTITVNNSVGVRSVCVLQFVLWLSSFPTAISNRKWPFHLIPASHNESDAGWNLWALSEFSQECMPFTSRLPYQLGEHVS
jgi:hypothetical protein